MFVLVAATCVAYLPPATAVSSAPDRPAAALADPSPWRWVDADARFEECVRRANQGDRYQVVARVRSRNDGFHFSGSVRAFEPVPRSWAASYRDGRYECEVTRDGQTVYGWNADPNAGFVIDGDRLFYATPTDRGRRAWVVRVDLRAGLATAVEPLDGLELTASGLPLPDDCRCSPRIGVRIEGDRVRVTFIDAWRGGLQELKAADTLRTVGLRAVRPADASGKTPRRLPLRHPGEHGPESPWSYADGWAESLTGRAETVSPNDAVIRAALSSAVGNLAYRTTGRVVFRDSPPPCLPLPDDTWPRRLFRSTSVPPDAATGGPF